MKYVCAWLIRLYRKFLSPLKRNPCCRFTPSCSAYALEAFMNRGFFVGLWLTVRRILRCNPFCAGGYDPVPPKRIPKYQRNKTDGKESVPNPGADNDNQSPKNQQENGSV